MKREQGVDGQSSLSSRRLMSEVALGSSTVICRLVIQAAESPDAGAGADEKTARQAFEACCNTIVCYCYRAEEYATSGPHHFTLKRLLGQAIKLVTLHPR